MDKFSNEEIITFSEYSSLRIWYNDIPKGYPAHWHTVLEIILSVDNYYYAEVNGIHYRIMPGEILIIPPGMMHELTAPPTGARLIYLFDISILSENVSFGIIPGMHCASIVFPVPGAPMSAILCIPETATSTALFAPS